MNAAFIGFSVYRKSGLRCLICNAIAVEWEEAAMQQGCESGRLSVDLGKRGGFGRRAQVWLAFRIQHESLASVKQTCLLVKHVWGFGRREGVALMGSSDSGLSRC